MQRRLEDIDLLAIYIDGIVVDRHHILAAVGIDSEGCSPRSYPARP